MKHIIINPAASAGETGKRTAEILAVLDRHFTNGTTILVTGEPGEAEDSAYRAAAAGAELIVAVGGDGTLQEVVNGLFRDGRPVSPGCRLGIISLGTGRGFAASLGLPCAIEDQAALIARGEPRPVDVGHAFFSRAGGTAEERYFINQCQAGIGSTVIRKVAAWRLKGKPFGGRLAFGAGTLSACLRAPNQPVSVEVDGRRAGTHTLLGVIAANGSRPGGGMRLTPRARVDDGLLDILLIHGQSVPARLRSFLRVCSGRHAGLAGFSYFRARSISLASDRRVDLAADGELWGALPCRLDILPSALEVFGPCLGLRTQRSDLALK